MSATIRIPTPLRGYAAGEGEVEVEATTAGAALTELTARYPELRRHLYTDEGELRSFVNVYVNEDDIRQRDGDRTAVDDGDTVTIVPSIAGGAPSGSGGADAAQDADRAAEAVADRAAAAAPTEADADAGGGVAGLPELSSGELARYSRHIIMPEVGREGQRRLKDAKVLLVGAGGLGSPLGLYLAAAGVGTLGLVDFDVVDATNLQRQVLYGTEDVGRPKLDAAAERLGGVNPHVELVPHETRLTSENALDLLEPYDVVVDGTDNFPTRYLVNDACVLLGKPNVYGSIFRFEGQVSVFDAREGPCYRCLFREPPPPGLVPSCAEGGVLGVLPGIIGSLQALEVVKLVLGTGEPLVGRLLLFDALGMSWRELKLHPNPDCPVCGEDPTQTELIDYEAFCGLNTTEANDMNEDGIPEISVTELKQRLDEGDEPTIIDVREPYEWEIANLEPYGSRLIPLGELMDRTDELDPDEEIVLHCRSGGRSGRALRQLRAAGFDRLMNLEGGILAWAEEIDPSLQQY